MARHRPEADYGRFVSDRRHVLAASGTVNVWSSLNVAAVVSAISGAPINELVGRDVNGDNDTNDRPIRGIDDTRSRFGRRWTHKAGR